MLASLTREFVVPRRWLAAIPVLLLLWAAYDAYPILRDHARYQFTAPGDLYWSFVNDVLAVKYLIGLAAVLILWRARISVLGGALLALALAGLSAALLKLWILPILRQGASYMVGGLIGLAASPRGGGVFSFLLLTAGVPILVSALILATAVTVMTNVFAGESIRSRSIFALWGTNFWAAAIALVLPICGIMCLQAFYGDPAGGRGGSGLVPLAFALAAFVTIGLAHWLLYERALRPAAYGGERHLRAWLCAAVVAALMVLAPYQMLGLWGARFHTTMVRPALRTVGVLATPKLVIGSVRVELPYREGIFGATGQGAEKVLAINAIAHPYRSNLHPDVPIDIEIFARGHLGIPTNTGYIETDLAKALEQGAASQPLTLRYDFADRRRFRSIARYLPDHPDVVFVMRVRSRDVGFEELEDVLSRFIAERVKSSQA